MFSDVFGANVQKPDFWIKGSTSFKWYGSLPGALSCSTFPLFFPRLFTLLESQIELHIMCLLLLKCLETSMATAYPQEKAQRFGLTFKASSICLPETSPTFSPAAPLHTVCSLLQQTLPVGPVCTRPWKNRKAKKLKDVNLIGGVPSQLNYTWWAGRRLSCQLSLTPPSLGHSLTMCPLFSLVPTFMKFNMRM